MRRIYTAVGGAVMVASIMAGCSSGAKTNDATRTASAEGHSTTTVRASGTASTGATPGGSVGAGAAGGTSVPGQSTPQTGGTTVVGGGTPGAEATAGVGATPVPGTTAAARATAAAPTASATVASVSGDGFTLDLPPNPSGAFAVTVKLAGATNYRGFSLKLTYDASVLKATSLDPGSVLGSNKLCVPAQIQDGSAAFACTLLGSGTTSNAGDAAVVNFQVLKSGSVTIHFVTYDEDNSIGTYLVGQTPAGDPVAVRIATHDASVTVSP